MALPMCRTHSFTSHLYVFAERISPIRVTVLSHPLVPIVSVRISVSLSLAIPPSLADSLGFWCLLCSAWFSLELTVTGMSICPLVLHFAFPGCLYLSALIPLVSNSPHTRACMRACVRASWLTRARFALDGEPGTGIIILS